MPASGPLSRLAATPTFHRLAAGGLPALLLALVLFAATASRAAADVLCVDPAGGPTADPCAKLSPYTTLAAALGDAIDGDEIRLAVGTYSEAVTLTHALALSGGFFGGFSTPVSPTGTLLDGGDRP